MSQTAENIEDPRIKNAAQLHAQNMAQVNQDMMKGSSHAGAKKMLEEIAEREVERAELSQRIVDIDVKLEAAVQKHQLATTPIQNQLRALRTGKKSDGESEKARLLEELEAANSSLAKTSVQLNRERNWTQAEFESPRLCIMAKDAIRGNLLKHGDPKKILQRHAISEIVKAWTWQARPFEDAVEDLRQQRKDAEERRDNQLVSEIDHSIFKIDARLSVINAAICKARQDEQRLYQEIIEG